MRAFVVFFSAFLASAPLMAGDLERAARFAALEAEESAPSRTRAAESDVADQIRAFNASREDNLEFLKEKMLRLAAGPWSFLRGTAHLFYRRLDVEGLKPFITPATAKIVIHGDFHIQNCGTFEDARGKVRYDIQDFDDATRGPYVLDVLRAATSVLIMADDCDVSPKDAREAARALVEEYVESVDDAVAGSLDPDFAFKEDEAKGPVAEVLDRAKKVSRKDLIKKRTKNGRFIRGEKYFDVSEDLAKAIAGALKKQVRDVARKKSNGCGSLGLDNFLVLLDDDVILELKEQGPLSVPPCLPALIGSNPPALAADPAERAIAAQRTMQSNPDRLIDAVRVGKKSFLVREDSPAKDGLDPTDLKSPKDLTQAAKAVARLAAKGHTRQAAGLPAKLREAIGDKAAFVDAIVAQAEAMAKGVRADHREFLKSPLARGEW